MTTRHDACEWEIPDSWGDRPPPMCGHTLSIVNRKAYLVGGCGKLDHECAVFDHVYSLDLVSWKWTKLNPLMWYEVGSQDDLQTETKEMKNVLKFLGFGREKHASRAEVQTQPDDGKGSWKPAENAALLLPPQARWRHSACMIGPNHLLIFGGIGPDDHSTRLGDTWILHLAEPEPVRNSMHISELSEPDESLEGSTEQEFRARSGAGGAQGDDPPEGPNSFIMDGADDAAGSECRPVWLRPKMDVNNGPSPRSQHTAVFHQDKVWVYGGYGGECAMTQ